MKYRNDIDGLRAIAVIGVIFYHFGIGTISGGFVGVDVFFVLSGYLIGGITFSQLQNGQYSFSNFYFRRIRRLFPVYVFVMLVTFIIAYAIMLPIDFREFGQSIFASTIYISNILFFMEAGYFDTASHLKPLLHTWSLSIEEQFYLIFPLLAWITSSRSRLWIFIFFALLTVASFISSVLYIDKDSTAVFYLYPFRAWELFLGVILALNVIPAIRNQIVESILSILGIILILIPYFIYNHSTLFPGYSALLPCIGTALVIHTGSNGYHFIHKLLATSIPNFIGKISYSLYLWHWPVFVFFIYDKQEELSFTSSLILLILIFVLSILSWLFIETPFRKGKILFSKSKLSVFTSTAFVSVAFLVVGFYIHVTNGMPSRLNQDQSRFANIKLFGQLPNCMEHNNEIFPNIRHCKIGQPESSQKYTLIWGDSHAGAFAQGIIKAFDGLDSNILLAWSGGCPTLFDITKRETASTNAQDALCTQQNKAIENLIIRDAHKINGIVLIGRWSYYIKGKGYGIDSHNLISISSSKNSTQNQPGNTVRFTQMLKSTLVDIQKSGIKVFILEQVPEFTQFHSRKLAIELLNGSSNIDDIVNNYSSEKYSNVLARQSSMMELLQETDKQGISTTLKTHKYFCNNSICSTISNEEPMYFDNNHLSTYGAREISHIFEPVLAHINKTSAAE